MQFSRPIQTRIQQGEITACVRFWKRPQVMAGGHYPLGTGEIVVTSIREINTGDISVSMAHDCGFASVEELLQTAQHGTGHHIYAIRFTYREK